MLILDNDSNQYFLKLNGMEIKLSNTIKHPYSIPDTYKSNIVALGEGSLILSETDPLLELYLKYGTHLLKK